MSYELNDLVWSKMGGYPFWPSFVSLEPSTGLIAKGSGSKLHHHVTFLGDNSRGWVPASCVREFLAEDTGPDRNQDYRCKKQWEADHKMAMKLGLDLLLEKAGMVNLSWQGKLADRGKEQKSPQNVDVLEIEEEVASNIEKKEAIEICNPTVESLKNKSKIKQEIAAINDSDPNKIGLSSDGSSDDTSFSKEYGDTKREDEMLKKKEKVLSFKSKNKAKISKRIDPGHSDPGLVSPKGLQYKSSLPGKHKFAKKVLGIEKLEVKKGDKELKEGRENKNVVDMKKEIKDEKRPKPHSENSKAAGEHKFLVAEDIFENKYDIIKKRKHKSSHKEIEEVKKAKQSNEKSHKTKTRHEKSSPIKTDEIPKVKHEAVEKRSFEGCAECKSCLASNCGNCQFCLDSPSFGGPGVLTSLVICSQRICSRQEINLLKNKNEKGIILLGKKNEIKHYEKDDSIDSSENEKIITNQMSASVFCQDINKKIMHNNMGSGDQNNNDDLPSENLPGKRKRRSTKGCGCDGCISQNCGDCIFCLDMPAFGGMGKKRQRCKKRQCQAKGKGLQMKQKKASVENENVDQIQKKIHYWKKFDSNKKPEKKFSTDVENNEDILSGDYPTSSKISYSKVKDIEKTPEISDDKTQKKTTKSRKQPKSAGVLENPLSQLTSGESSDFSELEDFSASQFSILFLDQKRDKDVKTKEEAKAEKHKYNYPSEKSELKRDRNRNKIAKIDVDLDNKKNADGKSPRRSIPSSAYKNPVKIHQCVSKYCRALETCPQNTWVGDTSNKYLKDSVVKPSLTPIYHAVPPRCHFPVVEDGEEGIALIPTDNDDSDQEQEAPLGTYKIPKTKPEIIPASSQISLKNVVFTSDTGNSFDNLKQMNSGTNSDDTVQMYTGKSSDNLMDMNTERIVENSTEVKQSHKLKIFSGLSLIQEYDDQSDLSDLNSSFEIENIAKECPSFPKEHEIITDNTDEQEKPAIKMPVGLDSPAKKKRSSRWDVPPPTCLSLEETHGSNADGIQENQRTELNIAPECQDYNLTEIPLPDPVKDQSKSWLDVYQIKKETSSVEKSSSSKKAKKDGSEKRLIKPVPCLDGWKKYNNWGNPPDLRYKYQYGLLPQYDVSKDLLDKLPRKNIFDSHCHLDLIFNKLNHPGKISQGYLSHQIQKFSEFQTNFPDEIHDKFEGCITNFCDPKLWNIIGSPVLLNTLEKEAGIYYTLGCHPHFAEKILNKNCINKLESLLKWGKGGRCVALGECGLDLSNKLNRSKASLEIQKKAFKIQLELAMKLDLPLVLHIRDAEHHAIEVMKKVGVPANYPMHRHCFNDSWLACQRWMRTFPCSYIGLTNLVTYNSAKHVHEIASLISLDRLILETNAPYFPPRLISNFPTEVSHPGHVVHAAAQVAQLRNISLDTVLAANRKNVARLYKIKRKKNPITNE